MSGRQFAHRDDVHRFLRLIGNPAPNLGADDVFHLFEHIACRLDDVGVHLCHKLDRFPQIIRDIGVLGIARFGGAALRGEPLEPLFEFIVPPDSDALR